MDKRFVVGSCAFFKDFESFEPHDTDILLLEDNPEDYKTQSQIRLKGNCYFRWKRMSAQEFVDYHKNCKCGIFLGKFLVPEFAKEINLTIEQLKELSNLVDLLDEKHLYEKYIYEAYIENNDFYLTKEQLKTAFNIYQKSSSEIIS